MWYSVDIGGSNAQIYQTSSSECRRFAHCFFSFFCLRNKKLSSQNKIMKKSIKDYHAQKNRVENANAKNSKLSTDTITDDLNEFFS